MPLGKSGSRLLTNRASDPRDRRWIAAGSRGRRDRWQQELTLRRMRAAPTSFLDCQRMLGPLPKPRWSSLRYSRVRPTVRGPPRSVDQDPGTPNTRPVAARCSCFSHVKSNRRTGTSPVRLSLLPPCSLFGRSLPTLGKTPTASPSPPIPRGIVGSRCIGPVSPMPRTDFPLLSGIQWPDRGPGDRVNFDTPRYTQHRDCS